MVENTTSVFFGISRISSDKTVVSKSKSKFRTIKISKSSGSDFRNRWMFKYFLPKNASTTDPPARRNFGAILSYSEDFRHLPRLTAKPSARGMYLKGQQKSGAKITIVKLKSIKFPKFGHLILNGNVERESHELPRMGSPFLAGPRNGSIAQRLELLLWQSFLEIVVRVDFHLLDDDWLDSLVSSRSSRLFFLLKNESIQTQLKQEWGRSWRNSLIVMVQQFLFWLLDEDCSLSTGYTSNSTKIWTSKRRRRD